MGMTFALEDDGRNLTPFEVRRDPAKDWVGNCMAELDAYYERLKQFTAMDTSEVLETLSNLTARASEMRHQSMKGENNRMNSFRTRHVDPFLEECDRQFKTHSRIQAIREMEYKISRGDF